MPEPARKLLPLVLGLALLGLAFLGTPRIEVNGGFDSDGRQYGAMAGSDLIAPEFARQAPWAYRLVTPWLARQLPWDTLSSFRVLAFASGVLSLALLHSILAKLGFSPAMCLLGMALYGLDFWTLRFSAYSPAYVDHQTAVLSLLVVRLTLSRQFLAILPVLALGAVQKESLAAFGAFPAVALLRDGKRRDARGFLLAAALVTLPVAAVVAVRKLVPVDNSYDAARVLLQELSRCLHPPFWVVFVQATLTGLGVLPLVLALQRREWLGFLRAHPEWLVYLAISLLLLLGGTDKSRLWSYALPLVVVLALHAVERLRAAAEQRRFTAWLCLALGVHAFLGSWLEPMGTYEEYLARRVPEVAGRAYLPYVVRNVAVAVAFLAVTRWGVLSESRSLDRPRPVKSSDT